MATAVTERIYTRVEFLKELGISLMTFIKYKHQGILPQPPQQGTKGVYTQAYLEACRKALAAYRKTK